MRLGRTGGLLALLAASAFDPAAAEHNHPAQARRITLPLVNVFTKCASPDATAGTVLQVPACTHPSQVDAQILAKLTDCNACGHECKRSTYCATRTVWRYAAIRLRRPPPR